jgi:lipopolysaccharide/colanic/teichoic acid biosynthesis glycosyltransferase
MGKSLKRVTDIFLSLIAIILFSPVFLLVPIFIKLDSRGPAFFVHRRIGKDFKPFGLYKFRTMIHDPAGKGASLTANGDLRITRTGKILRKTKIDELPQIFNVLKGEMSFVGPRPEAGKYVELFRGDYEEILKIKPGITDYAAIEFRNEEEILEKYDNIEEAYIKEVLPQKIRLYKKYIREKGFLKDLHLLLLTVQRIIKWKAGQHDL